jgi:hypothetical protein
MLTSLWDLGDRMLPGDDRWRHVGDPVLDEYYLAEMGAAADILGSTGATVVWFMSPAVDPKYQPQLFMGKPPYHEADPARAARYNELLREMAATRPWVVLADLPSWLEKQPGGQLAPELRPDGAHFSPTSTLSVGAWAAPLIEAAGEKVKDQRRAAETAPTTRAP